MSAKSSSEGVLKLSPPFSIQNSLFKLLASDCVHARDLLNEDRKSTSEGRLSDTLRESVLLSGWQDQSVKCGTRLTHREMTSSS